MALLELKEVTVVDFLTIPEVALPLGSTVAKQNSILASAANPVKAAGTLTISLFNFLKSLFLVF